MEPVDIIAKLAKEHTIEDIINNIGLDKSDETYKDLAQDLYLDLLLKDGDTVKELYLNNELKYFVIRMVMLNVFSKNSPYFYTYKKNNMIMTQLDDETTEGHQITEG